MRFDSCPRPRRRRRRQHDKEMAQLAALDRQIKALWPDLAQARADLAAAERKSYRAPRSETQVWEILARADREALMLGEEACPWERREGESAAAYRAFCVYLDRGPERSLRKAYQADRNSAVVKVPGRWRSWSATHDWVERARAHDRYQRAVVNRQNMQEYILRNMRVRRRLQQEDGERWVQKSEAASRRYQEMVSAWEQAGLLCQGVTRAGNSCRRKAMAGASFCEAHVRFHPNRIVAWIDGVRMVERLDAAGQPFLVTREDAELFYNDAWSRGL